jgi:outer membrane protein, multidrug efflux system
MRKIHIGFIVLSMLVISSCRTLDTNLSISKRKIPDSFRTSYTDTTTMADINWREFFADEYLLRLIDTALVSNFDLQLALQRIEIARSALQFSIGELLPKVDGNIIAGLDKYAEYTPDYAGNSTTEYEPGKIVPNPLQNYFVGLTTIWEIDIWGRLRNQRKAAISNYLASVEGKNFVVSNLVAEISFNYYELIALDNELEIIRQTIQKQQEALEVVKIQKEVGRANELAVQQFQAQLLNSQSLEQEKMQQITETENRINFIAGRFPHAIARNKDALFMELPKQVASGIPSQLLSHRPDIREAEYQVQASKFDLKTAKAAFYPGINIGTALGFQAFDIRYLVNTPSSIGYSALSGLAAPLVNMNALKAQFNTAKANQLTALYNYQKTILNGYVEVVNELSNIHNLRQIHWLKKLQDQALEISIEASTELYRTAKANYLEVLIAQQNSLHTKLDLIDVSKRQQIAIVNIYKALGGGW